MENNRRKNLIKYVIPTILSNVCFLLFTIVDALYILTTIGGVTIVAIRLGRGDDEGANKAFMHALVGALTIVVILCLVGACLTDPVLKLLGADGVYHDLAREYLFWYSVFIIPAGLSVTMQGFCRNDGSPILVSVAVVISTLCNIFGDWYLIFPKQMGMSGAAIATGISQTIAFLIVLSHFLRKKGKAAYWEIQTGGRVV